MRDQRVVVLCDKSERQQLRDLSERLARSQGDTVRFLIRQASRGDQCLEHQAGERRQAQSVPS